MIHRLRMETKDELIWEPVRYKMAKEGVAARFTDKINGLYLDLFTTKIDNAPTQGKPGPRNPLNLTKGVPDAKDQAEFAIDLNHLSGRARTLSEAAIYSVKGYGYSLQKTVEPVAPVEEPPANKPLLRKFEKKAIIPMIAENSMTLDYDAIKRAMKKPKDADLELFLSREKSKSC